MLDAIVTIRGQQGVVLDPVAGPIPAIYGTDRTIGLCLDVDPSRDTTRWQAAIGFGERRSPEPDWRDPTARLGTTLCFDTPLPTTLEPTDDLAVCGSIVDRFDGSIRRLPCRRLAFRSQQEELERIVQERYAAIADRSRLGLDSFIARLDELALRAAAAGLVAERVSLGLIAIHFLASEGDDSDLREARDRLAAMPAWLQTPQAGALTAEFYYQRAEVLLLPVSESDQTEDDDAEIDAPSRSEASNAWSDLVRAEERFHRLAHPYRLSATMLRAELLANAGAAAAATQDLSTELDSCAQAPCSDFWRGYAQVQLAWLTLLDTGADDERLAAVEESLGPELAVIEQQGDPLETANQHLNLAYLALRRGRDPARALQTARDQLAQAESGGARRLLLERWAEVLAGRMSMQAGDYAVAIDRCSRAGESRQPTLEAWALSCRAEAYRGLGDLDRAAEIFRSALAAHERSARIDRDLRIPLGPGQRADDFAGAARVEMERGDPAAAWERLARLDRLAVDEAARRRCREASLQNDAAAQWRSLDRQMDRLEAELERLEARPGGDVRYHEQRRALQRQLAELWRRWPGCDLKPADDGDDGVTVRAVALDDEVVVLSRPAGRRSGMVEVAGRTPMRRSELLSTLDRVEQELERSVDDWEAADTVWRELLRPVSQALIPARASVLGPVSVWALHGPLQRVPLAALPLPGDDSGWLAERTAVRLRPAGTVRARRVTRAQAPQSERRAPLFVVDPNGDLPGSSRLRKAFHELFPDSQVVSGGEARRSLVVSSLDGARFAHFGTHGDYQPAFPELSSLRLADGALQVKALAELSRAPRFVNLSACHSGRWPVTADSGRFGLAGSLVRAGTARVVAARSALPDDLAEAFNRAFYREIAERRSVDDAYDIAHEMVRDRFPASSWANLMLLSAVDDSSAEPVSSSGAGQAIGNARFRGGRW